MRNNHEPTFADPSTAYASLNTHAASCTTSFPSPFAQACSQRPVAVSTPACEHALSISHLSGSPRACRNKSDGPNLEIGDLRHLEERVSGTLCTKPGERGFEIPYDFRACTLPCCSQYNNMLEAASWKLGDLTHPRRDIKNMVQTALGGPIPHPSVRIRPDWYY